MNKYDAKEISKLIHSIGLKHNLRDDAVREIIESQFRAIRSIMDETDIESLGIDECGNLKTNFMITHIGKIYSTEQKIINIKNRSKKYGNITERD